MKVPHWLQEALKKRFDDLSNKFLSKSEFHTLQTQSDILLNTFVGSITPDMHKSFLEWEERINFLHAMHSEWVYMKGVQDGLELLTMRYRIVMSIEQYETDIEIYEKLKEAEFEANNSDVRYNHDEVFNNTRKQLIKVE
jgi:hypothetical protein